MKLGKYTFVVVLILVFGVMACSKCDECQSDLSARFRFVDTLRQEVNEDPALIEMVDLFGNTYDVSRKETEEDTFHVVNLMSISTEFDNPDTLLLRYNNIFIDTVGVGYTFSSDSRCCTNTLMVGKLEFFNKTSTRRIKPEFVIYDVRIED
ncbi:hypothetical protein [Fulvivirga lutimaris]|uniref:hypothetical protein n=1 Tax=Fulvivirga lutimaris TaxID=1819566 RepID=UPI0012BB9ECC|nr:hypothetical protein [Fulvivirga lutimaris]MTI41100.1 hypothetical protein [Fulvivirga lutimaris]